MQTRQLGRTGLTVSRLGLGTMGWGSEVDEFDAAAQLDAFLDAGGTLLDTAAGYADGESERILGSLLTGPVRAQVVLATKAGISRRSGERVVDTSRRALLDTLDGSLRRLGVDHVDLWQVHAWGAAPWEETLAALDAAVASGRARYVGISNYNGWQTGTAAAWQRAWPGRAQLASTQVEWSLLRREVEAEVIPAAAAHGLGVLVYAPLAGGVLTGKYARGMPAHSRGADPQWRDRIEADLSPRAGHILDALAQASEGLDTSPLTTALAWVRDQPEVSAALVGARTPAQLRMTLAAESFELPIEIRRALDEVSADE